MTIRGKAKLSLLISMTLFGTIGLFVRYIDLPSSLIALCRAMIGTGFLAVFLILRRRKPDWLALRKNLLWLILSGVVLGFNWIALFEAYRYTTVAIATVCYYMAPILVVMLAPILLKERLSVKKLMCVVCALLGMYLITIVPAGGQMAPSHVTGILVGLLAAVLYACVILCNKQIHGMDALSKTVFQLAVAAAVLLPYTLCTVRFDTLQLHSATLPLLLVIGVVHTGITYLLYFGAMEAVTGQSIAVISYLDPVVAVILSVLVLAEPMSFWEWIGAGMILSAAFVSEINLKRKKQDDRSSSRPDLGS